MKKFINISSVVLILSGVIGTFTGMGEWEMSIVVGGAILIATGLFLLYFKNKNII